MEGWRGGRKALFSGGLGMLCHVSGGKWEIPVMFVVVALVVCLGGGGVPVV